MSYLALFEKAKADNYKDFAIINIAELRFGPGCWESDDFTTLLDEWVSKYFFRVSGYTKDEKVCAFYIAYLDPRIWYGSWREDTAPQKLKVNDQEAIFDYCT